MRENGRDKINEQGAIVLPRLPAGNELLQVAYVPDEGAVLFSDLKKLDLADGDHHQLRLELQPAVRVEGRLDGPVARPVREGRVIGEVIQWDENVQHPLTWRAAAKMRIDGSFVFEAMPRGDLQVIALCTGAMAADGEPPAFARDHEKQQGASFFCRPQVFKLAEETTRIVVKMTPTADCLVHVVGPDGVAVEGADCASSGPTSVGGAMGAKSTARRSTTRSSSCEIQRLSRAFKTIGSSFGPRPTPKGKH